MPPTAVLYGNQCGDLGAVEAFLQNGGNPNMRVFWSWHKPFGESRSLLSWAVEQSAERKDAKCIELLLVHGADPRRIEMYGGCSISIAESLVKQGQLSRNIVKLLRAWSKTFGTHAELDVVMLKGLPLPSEDFKRVHVVSLKEPARSRIFARHCLMLSVLSQPHENLEDEAATAVVPSLECNCQLGTEASNEKESYVLGAFTGPTHKKIWINALLDPETNSRMQEKFGEHWCSQKDEQNNVEKALDSHVGIATGQLHTKERVDISGNRQERASDFWNQSELFSEACQRICTRYPRILGPTHQHIPLLFSLFKFQHRKFCVLALDGGGYPGGMAQIQMLTELENNIKKITKNDSARLVDYFDLIAGTSVGGILALSLVYGTQESPKERSQTSKSTLSQCNEFLKRIGPLAFEKQNVFGFKRNTEELSKGLRNALGWRPMSAVAQPKCIVTSRLQQGSVAQNFFFRNYFVDPNRHPNAIRGSNRGLVWFAARCSSAAPKYFDNVVYANDEYFFDGGFGGDINNPAEIALQEAHYFAKNVYVVSVGSGLRPDLERSQPHIPVQPLDFAAIIREFFFLFFDNGLQLAVQTERTHAPLTEQARKHQIEYSRLNIQLKSKVDLGDCSAKARDVVHSAFQDFQREGYKDLQDVAQKLVEIRHANGVAR